MVAHRTPIPVIYRLVAAVLRPLMRLLTRYEVSGTEHVPAGGFIATINHVSHADPFPFAHVLYDRGIAPVFLAKRELFDTPVVGWVMRRARQVPVYRESHAAGVALRAAVAALAKGECVAVYPEGSITRDPDLWPMRGKSGAARLAIESGCPVVPVVQWGIQDLLPPYATVPRAWRGGRRTRVQIRFGAPVDLADLPRRPDDRAVVQAAADRIMLAITRELEVLRGERAPTDRFDPAAHGLRATGDYRRDLPSARRRVVVRDHHRPVVRDHHRPVVRDHHHTPDPGGHP